MFQDSLIDHKDILRMSILLAKDYNGEDSREASEGNRGTLQKSDRTFGAGYIRATYREVYI